MPGFVAGTLKALRKLFCADAGGSYVDAVLDSSSVWNDLNLVSFLDTPPIPRTIILQPSQDEGDDDDAGSKLKEEGEDWEEDATSAWLSPLDAIMGMDFWKEPAEFSSTDDETSDDGSSYGSSYAPSPWKSGYEDEDDEATVNPWYCDSPLAVF
jgi:hypothetical protein